MNIDPAAAPRTGTDLGRRLKWIEDRLKYLASSNAYLSNGSVGGGSVTINEILGTPDAGVSFYEDAATATSDGGPVRVVLTYLPKDHSEHVYWNGLYQPASEWTRSGLILTFNETRIRTTDVVTVEYAYDPTNATAVPGPDITSPTNGSTTSDSTPTITGTGAAGRPLQVLVDGVSMGTVTIADDGTWSLTATTLSIGAHVITAIQTDVDTTTRSATVGFSVVSATPATAVKTGSASGHYSTSAPITSFPLPAGAVLGDLIVISTNGAVTDPRLNLVGSSGYSTLWIGFATTLADVTVDMSSSPGLQWTYACFTLTTNAVDWTTASIAFDTSMSGGDTLALPQIPGVSAAVCGIYTNHSVVDGGSGQPTGWTAGAHASNAKKNARADFWVDPSIGTSPAGPTSLTGGSGRMDIIVVGLIGP